VSKDQKKRWAVVTDGNRQILAKLDDKQDALECEESLRRLTKLAVHVESLFHDPKSTVPVTEV
jgi:hypothetical protein